MRYCPYIEPGYEICLECQRRKCQPAAKDCPLKAYHKALHRKPGAPCGDGKGKPHRRQSMRGPSVG